MTTLSELRSDVRSHLDEATAQFWSNDELNRWIYEGLRDVARRTETLQAVKAYTTIPSQPTYPAPPDMIRIYRVEFVQTDTYRVALEYRPLNSMDDVWFTSRTVSGSIPYWWSYWGFPAAEGQDTNQLYIYPATDDNIRDGLLVFYYRLPRKPEADDEHVDISSGWEDLIPLYAEYVGRRKDNDPRWKEALDIYEQRLETMMSLTRHASDQQHFFSGDGSGGLGRLPYWLHGGWDY